MYWDNIMDIMSIIRQEQTDTLYHTMERIGFFT